MRLRATQASLPAVLLAAVVLATGCSTPGDVPTVDPGPQAGQQQNGDGSQPSASKASERPQYTPRTVAGTAVKGRITVLAPDSLKDVLGPIGKAFEKENAGTSVAFVTVPSEKVTSSVLSGQVKPDFVITGSSPDMGTLFTKNIVAEPAPVARSFMVVVVSSKNPAKVKSVADLKGKNVALCAANVGCGESGAALLTAAKVNPGKATRAPGAAGVLELVSSGRADAGVVGAVEADGASKIKTIEAPAELRSVTLNFYAAPVLKTANGGTATGFLTFLAHSAQAADAFKQAGLSAG